MICLEQYRFAIGCFLPNVKVKSKNHGVNELRASNRQTKWYNFSISIWLIIFGGFVMNTQYENNFGITNNKLAHITYGNKIVNNKSSIKIIHWNKGLSLLQNKVNHIKHLIQFHKPHIFSISEANYDISNKIFNLGLDDYNIEYTDQCNNYNISRQIILIDRQLSYSRWNYLEK